MEKKFDVILNHSRFGYGKNNSLYCGLLTRDQIKQYLDELATKKIVPEYSCAHHLSAVFSNKETAHVFLERKSTPQDIQKESDTGCLNLYMTNMTNKCSGCCFENIKNGKCIDQFIIKTIGEKFFADKYKNEKQR